MNIIRGHNGDDNYDGEDDMMTNFLSLFECG